MFLFLQFILDNVRPYADVHALCLTSTESIEFMTRYYRCVKPMALPFPRHRLKKKGASAWDKFTNYFLSKPVFRKPSEHRMRLCILLDFLKATHHHMTAMPDPRDIIVTFNGFGYFRHFDTWFADFNIRNDMPFFFHMTTLDLSCIYDLHGIVFTELEYMSQLYNYIDKHTNAIYDIRPYLYFIKAHVVQTLGRTYVIVLLRESHYWEEKRPTNQKIRARIADGANTHSTDVEAFAKRFSTD